MTMLYIIRTLFTGLIIASIMYTVLSMYCVWDFFGRKKKKDYPLSPTPVSLVKPITGIDAGVKENLRSFCSQDYPIYEVLVGMCGSSGMTASGMHEFVTTCHDLGIRGIVATHDLGSNKKVSNLHGLVASARYDLLALSDSDMRVDQSYLARLVADYDSDKNIGLVTCMYKISEPVSIGATLESLSIAFDFIPSVLVARKLEGITFGLGATLLISKQALNEIGGLTAIADYLADDYQIGNRLWQLGYKIVLSDMVIENIVGPMSISDYFTHQVRWARTCRTSRPRGYAGLGITHLFALSLLFVIMNGATVFSMTLLLSAFVLRFGLAAMVYAWVIKSKRSLKWIFLLPIKDMMSFVIWLWSFMDNKVVWKGTVYRILQEGRIKEERVLLKF